MTIKTKSPVKRQSKKWVNYQQLKDRMDFQRVLEEYGVEVTRQTVTCGLLVWANNEFTVFAD